MKSVKTLGCRAQDKRSRGYRVSSLHSEPPNMYFMGSAAQVPLHHLRLSVEVASAHVIICVVLSILPGSNTDARGGVARCVTE